MKGKDKSEAKYRVLVVEDDQDVMELLNKLVTDLGYTPVTARNVTKALRILQESKVDILVLDLNLQEESGLDLLRALDRRGLKLPTVVVSGYISVAIARQLLELGVSGMVTKPFKVKRLASEIQKILHEEDEGSTQCQSDDPVYQRRRSQRIQANLTIRPTVDKGGSQDLRLLNLSSTGMQTQSKDMTILEKNPHATVAKQEFRRDICDRLGVRATERCAIYVAEVRKERGTNNSTQGRWGIG